MSEKIVQMHGKKNSMGQRDELFPISKAYNEIADPSVPRFEYSLYALQNPPTPSSGVIKQLQNHNKTPIMPQTKIEAVYVGEEKATDYLSKVISVNISRNAWGSAVGDNTLGDVKTQNGISVPGVLADASEQEIKWQGSTYDDVKSIVQYQIICGKQDAGRLTFWASETPNRDVNILVSVQKLRK